MTKAIFVGDIVNPKSGLTIKQENLKIKHKIPIDTLVEVNCDYIDEHGLRLFVVEHARDCDGTPLYTLSFNKSNYFNEHIPSQVFAMAKTSGFSEDCLIIIKESKND